MFIYPIH